MDLFSSTDSFLGNGFGGDMIKMAFAGGASKTQGKWNRRLVKRENELARGHSIDMVKLGNELDMANQKEMFDYRIQQGKAAGMTDYEMFMGPAAGAGGGTTGSGSTLGNQPAQLAANATSAANARMQAQTQLGTAMIQANAQRDVAKTQADATTGAATINSDIQKSIAEARLGFDNKVFKESTLPQASANIGLTQQQTLKVANEVITSSPKFVKMLTLMKMGSENILATMVANGLPIDITDPNQVKNMTEKQREQVMTAILSLLSQTRKETEGLASIFRMMSGSNAASQAVTDIAETLGNAQWEKSYSAEEHPSGKPPADRTKSIMNQNWIYR
jgi:hypothetical protein